MLIPLALLRRSVRSLVLAILGALRLNNVTGAEVQTRTTVIFRPCSLAEKEKDTAEALCDLVMFAQDKNNYTYHLSHVVHELQESIETPVVASEEPGEAELH